MSVDIVQLKKAFAQFRRDGFAARMKMIRDWSPSLNQAKAEGSVGLIGLTTDISDARRSGAERIGVLYQAIGAPTDIEMSRRMSTVFRKYGFRVENDGFPELAMVISDR